MKALSLQRRLPPRISYAIHAKLKLRFASFTHFRRLRSTAPQKYLIYLELENMYTPVELNLKLRVALRGTELQVTSKARCE